MLARATLLLRLATGAAKDLLGQAAIDYSDFEWWCEQLGSARALIASGELPVEPSELWPISSRRSATLTMRPQREWRTTQPCINAARASLAFSAAVSASPWSGSPHEVHGLQRHMLQNGFGEAIKTAAEDSERVVDLFAGSAAIVLVCGQASSSRSSRSTCRAIRQCSPRLSSAAPIR